MARYFLHLRDGTDELLDPEGVEFADLDAVRKAVVVNVRDVMAGQIQTAGILDLRYQIDAEDEVRAVVYSLRFDDAVRVIPRAA
jgi:hypothetical protein